MRRPSVFSKYELPNAVLSIDVPVLQIQEQRVEVQRDDSQKRLQQHSRSFAATQWSTVCRPVTSLRNSGNRQRLQNVWPKRQVECKLSGDSNTQVQHIDMDSQNVPKAVEVSQQHNTDMNVDVPAEMQRQITSTHRWCRKQRKAEQIPLSCTSGRRHCRTATEGVNDSIGTGVSTLTTTATRAE